jgi:hypothetical protein
MCLICWITISCKKTRHHDGPGDQEVGDPQGAEQPAYQVKDDGDDLKTGVIKALIGETLGLVSVSRPKALRLSVLSRSRSDLDY